MHIDFMKKGKNKNKKNFSLIFWAPRILTIIFILFISLFALDVFDGNSGLKLFLALIIHLIPSIILTIFLLISWKYEIIGAIGFSLLGLIYLINVAIIGFISWAFIISGPLFLLGILFYISWKNKKIN